MLHILRVALFSENMLIKHINKVRNFYSKIAWQSQVKTF